MKKKALYLCMVLVMVLVCTCSNIVFAVIPRFGIGSPSSGTVEVGGTITYPVSIYNGATSVTLKPSDVRLIGGVTANISISGSGNTERTIVLSNIQGSVGATGQICIVAGAASNASGGSKETGYSTGFTIVASYTPAPTPTPTPSTPSNNGGNNNSSSGNTSTLPPSTENNNGNINNNTETEKTEEKDEVAPTMEIGEFSKSSCELGDEISFDIIYKDNKEVSSITLEKKDITLYGFKADIKITGEGNGKRTVTLSNISGNLGGLKYVTIAAGTAQDKAGNKVKESGKTTMFKVVNSDTKSKPDDWIENPNTGR